MVNKNKVVEAVEAKVVESTALTVAPTIQKLSQKVVKEEMELAHNQQFATLAINDAIANDKAAYEKQLDSLSKAFSKERTNLEKAETVVTKATESLERKSLSKTVLPEIKAVHSKVTAIKCLSKKIKMPEKNSISISYCSPRSDGKSKLEKEGHIGWSVTLSQVSRYDGLSLSGMLPLNKECKDALKEVAKVNAKIGKLKAVDKNVRMAIQDLDREKAQLQRKLDREALNKSITGKEMTARVKSMRATKVKALPTGIL